MADTSPPNDDTTVVTDLDADAVATAATSSLQLLTEMLDIRRRFITVKLRQCQSA